MIRGRSKFVFPSRRDLTQPRLSPVILPVDLSNLLIQLALKTLSKSASWSSLKRTSLYSGFKMSGSSLNC
jgi:hypothetical protein